MHVNIHLLSTVCHEADVSVTAEAEVFETQVDCLLKVIRPVDRHQYLVGAVDPARPGQLLHCIQGHVCKLLFCQSLKI